jgi:hypothetical protein
LFFVSEIRYKLGLEISILLPLPPK